MFRLPMMMNYFQVITSPHVPQYESTMLMIVRRFPRWPWQKRYLTHTHTRVWYAVLKMGYQIVCHPSDYQRIKEMVSR